MKIYLFYISIYPFLNVLMEKIISRLNTYKRKSIVEYVKLVNPTGLAILGSGYFSRLHEKNFIHLSAGSDEALFGLSIFLILITSFFAFNKFEHFKIRTFLAYALIVTSFFNIGFILIFYSILVVTYLFKKTNQDQDLFFYFGVMIGSMLAFSSPVTYIKFCGISLFALCIFILATRENDFLLKNLVMLIFMFVLFRVGTSSYENIALGLGCFSGLIYLFLKDKKLCLVDIVFLTDIVSGNYLFFFQTCLLNGITILGIESKNKKNDLVSMGLSTLVFALIVSLDLKYSTFELCLLGFKSMLVIIEKCSSLKKRDSYFLNQFSILIPIGIFIFQGNIFISWYMFLFSLIIIYCLIFLLGNRDLVNKIQERFREKYFYSLVKIRNKIPC